MTIEGMMCQQSCGSTVANALRNVPGVSRAEASFADHNASVWGDVDVALLIDAVECVGFGAEVSESKPMPATPSLKRSREFRVNGMRTLTDALVNGGDGVVVGDRTHLVTLAPLPGARLPPPPPLRRRLKTNTL